MSSSWKCFYNTIYGQILTLNAFKTNKGKLILYYNNNNYKLQVELNF